MLTDSRHQTRTIGFTAQAYYNSPDPLHPDYLTYSIDNQTDITVFCLSEAYCVTEDAPCRFLAYPTAGLSPKLTLHQVMQLGSFTDSSGLMHQLESL